MDQETNESNLIDKKHLLPFGSRTLDPAIRIVDRALEIETASEFIKSGVKGKLDLILKQIQNLQEEARRVLEQAQMDEDLHRITCNFEKKVGDSLHLYQKEDGTKYFSILSPSEWGNPPHTFLGSYRLEGDRSFTPLD